MRKLKKYLTKDCEKWEKMRKFIVRNRLNLNYAYLSASILLSKAFDILAGAPFGFGSVSQTFRKAPAFFMPFSHRFYLLTHKSLRK